MSQEPLMESGVHGMSSVVNYVQGIGYVLVQGHASAHQKAVFRVFVQSFAPFRNDNFGTVSNAALRQSRASWVHCAFTVGVIGTGAFGLVAMMDVLLS